ncbi:MAG: hypothetical protein JWN62_4558 [Acidimicrobiales bacterium]|nr:hypothetical protein [Acidimicrobiales bacterium]
MTDHKPPRLTGDERAVVTSLLAYQRASLLKKLDGIDNAQAAASPIASGTSLLWLINHVADAEAAWVLRRFAGHAETGVGDHEPTIEAAIRRYRAVSDESDVLIAQSSLDELCRAPDSEPVPDLRWVITHLLEETARHAGHADILRELIDGSTGR